MSCVVLLAVMLSPGVRAQELSPGSYFYYVPEHEKYGRTAFYSIPSFSSGQVRVTTTQRFQLLGASKGWAAVRFDVAGKAFIHLRILRTLVYDPAASDPFYEFQRASVFSEPPEKIEARLKAPAPPSASVTDSKTPSWKRYKDSWNLKPARTAETATPEAGDGAATTAGTPSASPGKKPRSKYPLLPPIGAEPPQEAAAEPGAAPGEPLPKQNPR